MRTELNSVHFIRASASLSVCLFHLFCGNTNLFPSENIFKPILAFGHLGVIAFFMLSGFIICYALSPHYTYSNFTNFISKRILRIEPPYILSILLILVLNSLSSQITGLPYPINWWNILSHIAYLNNFVNGEYLNVVYWTLGIEFQFYFIIALIFPLIYNKTTLVLFMCGFIGLSCIPVYKETLTILPYLSIFGLGMLIYYFKTLKIIDFWLSLLLSVGLLTQINFYLGISAFLTCIFCSVILLFWEYKHRWIYFFSSISFSLYLTHVPIGGKVINLGLRFVDSLTERYILFITALVISVIFAHIFYIAIEKPAIRWSKKIQYKRDITP